MPSRSRIIRLRAQAHGRIPVVRVGRRGPTDAVVAEPEHARELVELRLAGGDRAIRVAEPCARTGAGTVPQIGATASMSRRDPERHRITPPER